jgi:hypothetical protein
MRAVLRGAVSGQNARGANLAERLYCPPTFRALPAMWKQCRSLRQMTDKDFL